VCPAALFGAFFKGLETLWHTLLLDAGHDQEHRAGAGRLCRTRHASRCAIGAEGHGSAEGAGAAAAADQGAQPTRELEVHECRRPTRELEFHLPGSWKHAHVRELEACEGA